MYMVIRSVTERDRRKGEDVRNVYVRLQPEITGETRDGDGGEGQDYEEEGGKKKLFDTVTNK